MRRRRLETPRRDLRRRIGKLAGAFSSWLRRHKTRRGVIKWDAASSARNVPSESTAAHRQISQGIVFPDTPSQNQLRRHTASSPGSRCLSGSRREPSRAKKPPLPSPASAPDARGPVGPGRFLGAPASRRLTLPEAHRLRMGLRSSEVSSRPAQHTRWPVRH
jgi:hypothetical protein